MSLLVKDCDMPQIVCDGCGQKYFITQYQQFNCLCDAADLIGYNVARREEHGQEKQEGEVSDATTSDIGHGVTPTESTNSANGESIAGTEEVQNGAEEAQSGISGVSEA